MTEIKEKWKKLKYWQKGGIALGVFHIMFLSITLLIIASEECNECAILIAFPEIIPRLIFNSIFKLSNSKIDLWHFHDNAIIVMYALGTIVYSIFGVLIGYLIDKGIERRKK